MRARSVTGKPDHAGAATAQRSQTLGVGYETAGWPPGGKGVLIGVHAQFMLSR